MIPNTGARTPKSHEIAQPHLSFAPPGGGGFGEHRPALRAANVSLGVGERIIIRAVSAVLGDRQHMSDRAAGFLSEPCLKVGGEGAG